MDSPERSHNRLSLSQNSSPSKSPSHYHPPRVIPQQLLVKPFKATNTRRDVSTSFKCIQIAFNNLVSVQVLNEECNRLADRAVQVLLAVTDQLKQVEDREGQFDMLNKKAYEYSSTLGSDTVFKIQSILIDLQAFSSDFSSSCTKDRLRLLISQLPSSHASLATLTKSLSSAISFYSLTISTASWSSEDFEDRQKDLDSLPRLFRVAFAPRGPVYEEFMLEQPSPNKDSGKRREEFLEWCLDKNESLRPKDGMSPIRAFTLPTPPASPISPTMSAYSSSPTNGTKMNSPKRSSSASVLVPYKYGPSSKRPDSLSLSTKSTPDSTCTTFGSPTAISSPVSMDQVPDSIMIPAKLPPTPPSAKIVEEEGEDEPENQVSSPSQIQETEKTRGDVRPESLTSSGMSHSESSSTNNSLLFSPLPSVDSAEFVGEPVAVAEEVTTEAAMEVEQVSTKLEAPEFEDGPDSPETPVPHRQEEAKTTQPALSPIDTTPSADPASLLTPISISPASVYATPTSEKRLSNRRLSALLPTLTLRPATPVVEDVPMILSPAEENTGVRVLCLDGGGIRGLTLLLTLKSAMASISGNKGVFPRPCEHFDLIAGVGSGGLIAILLGRLRLSVTEAIDLYICIATRAFLAKDRPAKRSAWSKLFSSSSSGLDAGGRDVSLEKALKAFLPDSFMLEEEDSGKEPECRTAVLTFDGRTGTPRWLRSYRMEEDPASESFSLQQVARATLVSTPFFNSYQATPISSFGESLSGSSSQNPSDLVLDEVRTLFGPASEVPMGCFLSLGVGSVPQNFKSAPNTKPSKTKLRSLRVVGDISVQATAVAERFEARAIREGWGEESWLRYSVDLGKSLDPGVEEWTARKKLEEEIEEWMRTSDALGSKSPLARGMAGGATGALQGSHDVVSKSSESIGVAQQPSSRDLPAVGDWFNGIPLLNSPIEKFDVFTNLPTDLVSNELVRVAQELRIECFKIDLNTTTFDEVCRRLRQPEGKVQVSEEAVHKTLKWYYDQSRQFTLPPYNKFLYYKDFALLQVHLRSQGYCARPTEAQFRWYDRLRADTTKVVQTMPEVHKISEEEVEEMTMIQFREEFYSFNPDFVETVQYLRNQYQRWPVQINEVELQTFLNLEKEEYIESVWRRYMPESADARQVIYTRWLRDW
ncbi:hypothetical protein T439DRAFT_381340 [Meredithblackwellia eburnea MCA 4105]